ncbi:MAG: aminodeoxychorismate/anthranilate synthase component II [Deltaproteobacteria bacterium]|nr:aminodeoxychorismate/anthranilate synthase component II [Deltaproteobacteria bacterium]
MRVLMLDNYDSFTWNLVQYLGELGATVEVHRNDAITVDEVMARAPDAIVVSPGPCTPHEAGISMALIKRASGEIPLLGVCLGHQSMAATWGGSIIRTGVVMHGKTSPIHHRDSDVFAGLPNPFDATRYHSLMADPRDLPACLEVTAWTGEGQARIIMGLAHREHPSWGVQFHPESILTLAGKALLANFLRLAEAFNARVRSGATTAASAGPKTESVSA